MEFLIGGWTQWDGTGVTGFFDLDVAQTVWQSAIVYSDCRKRDSHFPTGAGLRERSHPIHITNKRPHDLRATIDD
jgi:hypothetical protein